MTKNFQANGSQLPVKAYFDETIYEAEQKILFDQGIGYVGHELMVPQKGSYRSCEWMSDSHALVRDAQGVNLISNVCRHRQATMLKGTGKTSNIICPLHRWTYDLNGKLLGAPHFNENPCLNLEKDNLVSWNGLLFKGPQSPVDGLESMHSKHYFDFSGYVLDSVQLNECHYNWKTFIEVYLEDYHVDPSHPGLGSFVDCSELTWQFGDRFSVQEVGLKSLTKAGTEVYKRWQDVLMRYNQNRPTTSSKGAVWTLCYPNLMIEWYPHVLVVASLWPQGVDKTIQMAEFYYPEEIVSFEREFIETEQAAYAETAVEDDDFAERMDAGRLALYQQGKNEVGPYQSPMEDGMVHFHQYYRQLMNKHL